MAASSAVSVPTKRSFGSPRMGVEARISDRMAGAILQPQPPPWLNSVRRIFSGAFMGVEFYSMKMMDLASFESIIDTRSPAEYAEDHIPGAVSAPVLDNDERAQVGTLYKQVSQFDAKKVGAAL